MNHFSAEWLALREGADARARSPHLTAALADVCARQHGLRALDLATGTGANLRYLAEHLPAPQDWLLVDRDPVLLDRIPIELRAWAARRGYDAVLDAGGFVVRGEQLHCHVRMQRLDLSAVQDAPAFDRRTLVTASALLDLVSDLWLRALIARCCEQRSAILFALTYDGRMQCTPEEPEDEMIRELVNRHQRTDKGFGPALGPDAATRAAERFAQAGYEVLGEPSDWMLGSADRDLQRQLIEGWASAAIEIAPERSASIKSWRARRIAYLTDHRSQLIVGHQDLAAWLPS